MNAVAEESTNTNLLFPEEYIDESRTYTGLMKKLNDLYAEKGCPDPPVSFTGQKSVTVSTRTHWDEGMVAGIEGLDAISPESRQRVADTLNEAMDGIVERLCLDQGEDGALLMNADASTGWQAFVFHAAKLIEDIHKEKSDMLVITCGINVFNGWVFTGIGDGTELKIFGKAFEAYLEREGKKDEVKE